jgi:cytidylate kinase
VLRKTRARDERDRSRYLQLYDIDNDEFDFVDLVIDTQNIQPEDVAERIITAARSAMPPT